MTVNTGILLFYFALCEQAFAKHYPLFRVYIFRYITKKDIKFFAPLSFKKAVKTIISRASALCGQPVCSRIPLHGSRNTPI